MILSFRLKLKCRGLSKRLVVAQEELKKKEELSGDLQRHLEELQSKLEDIKEAKQETVQQG